MKLSLGFSPCPNDTFIFDALVNGKIKTGAYEFDYIMDDVQALNVMAMQGKLDVSKISYGVWPQLQDNYDLLQSGSALGSGVGPLLISARQMHESDVENSVIAIPGENTTAHLLFTHAYPSASRKVFLRYDEIENFVAAGKGLGVIIHENRFTYQERGLIKILDLGEHWEKVVGQPIPLGGIVIRKSLGANVRRELESLIKESIEFANRSYPQLNDFIRENAQEMTDEVMRKHIELYVNAYSLDLGEKGKSAVDTLVAVYNKMKAGS